MMDSEAEREVVSSSEEAQTSATWIRVGGDASFLPTMSPKSSGTSAGTSDALTAMMVVRGLVFRACVKFAAALLFKTMMGTSGHPSPSASNPPNCGPIKNRVIENSKILAVRNIDVLLKISATMAAVFVAIFLVAYILELMHIGCCDLRHRSP